MQNLFAVGWDDLGLDHVRAFLDAAEDEPLLWEAKGTKVDAHHVRKTVGGFANSHEGGCLILGASQAGRSWRLDGIVFPDEPPKWISSVIQDGLRPAPRTDVRAFPVENGAHVAVVRVLPLPDPPCVSRGTVYERVPGQTLSVKDPQRLADLYRRGDRAHASARARAEKATTAILSLDGELLPRRSRVALAVAPLEVPQPEVTKGLFAEAFESAAIARLRERVRHPSAPLDGKIRGIAGQDAVSLSGTDPSNLHAWRLRASWDGSVALGHVPAETGPEPLSLIREYVETAWTESLRLTRLLGCGAVHYVAVCVDGPQWAYKVDAHAGVPGPALVERGPIGASWEPGALDDVMAELERIRGRGLA